MNTQQILEKIILEFSSESFDEIGLYEEIFEAFVPLHAKEVFAERICNQWNFCSSEDLAMKLPDELNTMKDILHYVEQNRPTN